MAVQIRYRALPLGELFEYYKDNRFIAAVLERAEGQNWRGAWNEAADGFPELNDGDVELLTAIGNALGTTDTAGQTAMLELHQNLLMTRLTEAAEASGRKGAMYRSVGVLTGLGLAIIVI